MITAIPRVYCCCCCWSFDPQAHCYGWPLSLASPKPMCWRLPWHTPSSYPCAVGLLQGSTCEQLDAVLCSLLILHSPFVWDFCSLLLLPPSPAPPSSPFFLLIGGSFNLFIQLLALSATHLRQPSVIKFLYIPFVFTPFPVPSPCVCAIFHFPKGCVAYVGVGPCVSPCMYVLAPVAVAAGATQRKG